MNQRVYQVCLTYLRRWPILLVAVVYLGACGVAIHFTWFPNSQQPLRNASPDFPQPAPTLNVLTGMSLEQVPRETRSVFWNADRQAPNQTEISRPFPQLVSLQMVGDLRSGDELRILRSMPNLEAVSIFNDLPPDSIQHLGELHRLRYLRLLNLPPNQGLDPLRGLSQLQVLDVLQVPDYPRLFDEIRPLTSLRTLVLQGQIVATFQASDWERLRSLPHLRHLYLRGNATGPDTTRMEIDRVQQALPHVKVRPASVSEHRSNVWCYVVLASVLIWGVLCVQLQSHFSHSGSCVIPNYATYHLGVAVALWVVTTAIHASILWYANCSWPASLAGSLFIPGLFWWMIAIMLRSSHRQNQAGTLNPMFAFATCFYAFPITAMLSRVFISDLDWFLEGRQPVLAWTTIAASIASPILVFLRIPGLHAIYEECAAGVPPLGFNPKAWTTWGKSLAESQESPWKTWWRGNQSAHLDAVLGRSQPRDWSRLWSAGNVIDGPRLGIRVLTIWIVFAVVFEALKWLGIAGLNSQPLELPLIGTVGWMLVEMISFGPVMIWRERRPILGYELLRPSTRKEFVRQLFAAMWRDLRPLLICHLLAVAALLWKVGFRDLPHLFVPAALCYIVFRGLSIYAALLFLVALRHTWLAVVGLSVLWTVDSLAGIYLLTALFRADGWYPTPAISLFLTGGGLALLALTWLKGYWQRIELA